MEIEMRFRIPEPLNADIIAEYIGHEAGFGRFVPMRPMQTQNMLAFYYDTPGYDLSGMGIAYRVRREGGRWVGTIKTDAAAAAVATDGADGAGAKNAADEARQLAGGFLQRRNEWNRVQNGAGSDLSLFSDPEISKVLSKIPALDSGLEIKFSTCFRRRTIHLGSPGGTEIELAIDAGIITSGNASEKINILELELIKGSESEMIDISRIICQRYGLIPEKRTKYSIGLGLSKSLTQ